MGENMDTTARSSGGFPEPVSRAVPGRWRQDPELRQATLPHGTNIPARAKQHRDELCQYFNGVGAVPFQWDKI